MRPFGPSPQQKAKPSIHQYLHISTYSTIASELQNLLGSWGGQASTTKISIMLYLDFKIPVFQEIIAYMKIVRITPYLRVLSLRKMMQSELYSLK